MEKVVDTQTYFTRIGDLQVEVGDSKEVEFFPQVKLMRWDNEVNFSMRWSDPDSFNATLVEDGSVIKYIKPNIEIHQYEVEDGFEFEWVLKEKPDNNVLLSTIQSKELNFFYQPALTDEEIAEGKFRPENVVGSYAAYHKTKRDNRLGGKEYRTGKAFHIFRPQAVDALGKTVWCELHIDEQIGELTVTVPQDFLDLAVYPVKVDPTFGYTSNGATAQSTENIQAGSWFATTETSYVLKLRGYIEVTGIAKHHEGAIYTYTADNDANALVAQTYDVNIPIQATKWTDLPFSSVQTLSASTNYFLMVWAQSGTGVARLYYDTSSNKGITAADTGTWPDATYPSTMTGETGVNQIFSVYAVYATISPFFYDSISSGTDVVLSAHTPEIGTSWTKLWSDGSMDINVSKDTDSAYIPDITDSGVIYTADVTYPSADYAVESHLFALNNVATDPIYFLVRIQDQENMYAVRLTRTTGGGRLYKKVSGTWTALGSTFDGPEDGSLCKLEINGTSLKFYDDGVEVASATDSDISAAGKAGLAGGGGAELVTSTDDGDSVNSWYDFWIINLGAGGGGGSNRVATRLTLLGVGS